MTHDSIPYYLPGGLLNLFSSSCWLYAIAYIVIAGVKFYSKARKDESAAFACAGIYMAVVPFLSAATGAVVWVLFAMMSAGAASPWLWLIALKNKKQGVIGLICGVILPMAAVSFIAYSLWRS